jgi:hypothetical protein
MLCIHVRRLRCNNRKCAKRIFAERAEDLAGSHARRTMRLRDIQRSVDLAPGGEAAARLIERRVSADTMLRIVRDDGRSSMVHRVFWALTIGHGARDSCTVPIWAISRPTKWARLASGHFVAQPHI